MKRLLPAAVILTLCCGIAFAGEFRDISPDYTLTFPRDLYFKDGFRLQWWYFTGHLFDNEGKEFGYELTFFVVGVQRREFKTRFGLNNIYISHFAISDVNGKRYYFNESSDRGAYGFAGARSDELKVWVSANEVEGDMERMHLAASGGGNSLDLILTPVKRFVLNGEKGYSRKSEDSPDIASWYFSGTDLTTVGRLSIGGRTFAVSGKSWFDREISSGMMGKKEKGWDWFAIQLNDGREIMLYSMRKADGTFDRYSSGTIVHKDGGYRHLAPEDFTITVLSRYKSARTGAVYPSRWAVKMPKEDLDLRITPLLQDQEFIAASTTGNHYWEGTCKVEGTKTGRAYVEMTGY